MANEKKFCVAYTAGLPVVLTVQRRTDDFYLQADGSFGASIAYLSMTDDLGFFQYSTDVEVWATAEYNVIMREDLGGGDYTGILAYYQWISGDTQIGWVEASSVTAKNTASSLTTTMQGLKDLLVSQSTQLSVMSDRIDSLQQVLARRDYGSTTE